MAIGHNPNSKAVRSMRIEMEFSRIFDIDLENEYSWRDKIFLTFDIDWAHDEVLEDTINLVEKADVAATWFVTHDTMFLARLRANPKFELGIHPNFNFLLQADSRNGANAGEVIDRLLQIVPEAKSVRSHSLTQSSILLQLFLDKGLTHECNHFIPEQAAIELEPWHLWNGLIKVPHFWEDDVACMYAKNTLIQDLLVRAEGGVRVFAFHPIHIFLNTNTLECYERSRADHANPKKLITHRNTGFGVRSELQTLLGFL